MVEFLKWKSRWFWFPLSRKTHLPKRGTTKSINCVPDIFRNSKRTTTQSPLLEEHGPGVSVESQKHTAVCSAFRVPRHFTHDDVHSKPWPGPCPPDPLFISPHYPPNPSGLCTTDLISILHCLLPSSSEYKRGDMLRGTCHRQRLLL